MNQWINQFLENEIVNRTDKTDKPTNARPLSVLSVRTPELLDEKLEKVKNNPETGTDKTDKPIHEGPLSVLSVRLPGLLDENLVNMPEPDISDKLAPNLNLSDLSSNPQDVLERFYYSYGEQDFEERLAIAEYDGGKTSLHAHPIAYLDAFISTLTALPATASQRDWLDMRIQTALTWIESQNFPVLN